MTKHSHQTFLVLAVLLFCSTRLMAQLPDQRDSLKRLYPVVVGVQTLDNDARPEGLSIQQIRTDVELRLRRSGVPISEDKSDGNPAYPQLYVGADVAKYGDRSNYCVQLEVLSAVNHYF
jgi:hypothetical protein